MTTNDVPDNVTELPRRVKPSHELELEGSSMTISGKVEFQGVALEKYEIDEIVEVTVECRVTAVDLKVKETTGGLHRGHKVRPLFEATVKRLATPSEWRDA